MTQPGATEFSWKRELPFMLLPVVVVLLAHLPAAPYAEAVWNADGAITALIAKHHWQGQLPIYFYGQNYNGSIEPLFSAPFYKLYGASVEGIEA